MKIRIVKKLDLDNITLVRHLDGCPEDCTVRHCDLDDYEQEHNFDAQPTAYHNDPWNDENIEHLVIPNEDDDLWGDEEYDPLHYL